MMSLQRSLPQLCLLPCLLWLSAPLAAQPNFVPAASSAGIDVEIVSGTAAKKFLVETMTGGVCVLDYDGDRWPDLFFVNGTTRSDWNKMRGPSDRLFRNRGDGAFVEVTESAGLRDSAWGMGCATADFDNDGDTDLYVTNFGPNALYLNNGDGTFHEIAAQAGVADPLWGTGAAFGDYDKDGDLDLYVVNYVDFDFDKPGGDPRFCAFRGVTVACGPRGLPGAPDRLYRNNGDKTFQDVTQSSGIGAAEALYGFQVLWTDLEEDGDLDLFVANDSKPNFFWVNQGDGTFREEALFMGLAYNQNGREQACMGADVGDYDNDGRLDLYSTNFSDDYHVLYRNAGPEEFRDVTLQAKIGQVTFQALGFGAFFADFDNDSSLDIFVANGHIYPEVDQYKLGSTYKQKNQLFHNQGDGSFLEISQSAGPGMALRKSSRGAAYLDYDRDGDLDVVVVNLDDKVDLLRNDLSSPNNYLILRLQGRDSNRDGVGARVRLRAGPSSQIRELRSGSSYLSESERVAHFGLGRASSIQSLEIRWPSGREQALDGVPVNSRIVVVEGGGWSLEK